MKEFDAIRRFIHETVRRSYGLSGNLPERPLTELRDLSVLSSPQSDWQIGLPAGFNEEFSLLQMRLPQTRFFYTRLASLSLTVDWLDFCGSTLILLQNHSTQPLALTLTAAGSGAIEIFPPAASGRFTLESEMAIWNFSGDIHEVPSLLYNFRQSEYANHPLNVVSGTSFAQMMELDDAWTSLAYFDLKFNIKEKIKPGEFLWLQELLLFLGRYETLSRYYEDFKPPQSDALLNLAALRFKHVVQTEPVSPAPAGQEFLNEWLFPELRREEELLPKLQEIWEQFSWPLLRVRFVSEIQGNPHRWLAVYFLAQQYNFIWSQELGTLLTDALSGRQALLNIFKTLNACRRMVRYEAGAVSFSVSAGTIKESAVRFVQTAGGIDFKQTAHKISLRKESYFDFSSDRLLTLEFNTQQRLLRLRPLLSTPPLSHPPYRQIEVKVGAWRVSVPLIWQQFYIVFNGVRIRFLRKKKRFQLALKLPPHPPEVTIDRMPVLLDKGRYVKTYVNIKRLESRFTIQLADSAGRRLNGLAPADGRLLVSGTALDSFGLLHETFRLGRNDKPGSIEINGNVLPPEVVSLPHNVSSVTFTARRCEPLRMELNPANALLQRLWQTPPAQLSVRLTVFTEEKTALNVRQHFYDAWGFYPRVQVLEQSRSMYVHGDIVITSSQPAVLLEATSFGGVVRLQNHSAPQLIWIKPQRLEEFLKRGFRLLLWKTS